MKRPGPKRPPVLSRTRESYLRQNLAPKRPLSGYIYLVRASNNLTKIGFSGNFEVRFRSLKTHSPLPLEPIIVGYGDGANIFEYELHKRFGEFRSHGEWFSLPPDAINQATELIHSQFQVEGG